MGSSKASRFFIIVLVLAVLIIGGSYLLKQQNLQKSSSTAPIGQDTSKDGSVKQQPLRDSAGLPNPPATSSGKPVEVFVQTVKEDAKESSDLSFTNCKASPGVIKVKVGQKITIKNNDDKDIILQITVGAQPKIEAKKSISYAFTVGPAIYTYSCDHVGGDTVVKAGIINLEK
ncbi:hypothetical protein HYW41_00025 [Candidatus Daviesbacteria bacterium]|nr:hypothetical protein [Candidatus Daviesbacteria bacterium]